MRHIFNLLPPPRNRFPNPPTPPDFESLIDDCDDDTETSTLTSWVRMKKDAQAKIDQTHFEVLGVEHTCTDVELKKVG